MTEKPRETIREWYARFTRRARIGLAWATFVSVPVAVGFYVVVPYETTHGIQIFNGAYTIPVAAAIWIASFIYLFLIPSREGGFRTAEATERMEGMVRKAVEEDVPRAIEEGKKDVLQEVEKLVSPALNAWERLGKRLEARLDEGTLDRLVEALESVAGAGAPPPGRIPKPRPFVRKDNGEGGPR